MTIHALLNRMQAAERAFLETEFLAPVLHRGRGLQGGHGLHSGHGLHGRVQVRIAGLVCTLRVEGDVEPGWAILRPRSLEVAEVVARPSPRQVRDYLALFPAVRLILVEPDEPAWLALPAERGDRRLQLDGPVPVYLVSGAEPFQRAVARFDGTHFWFQEVDRRRSPAAAAYLRGALAAGRAPEALHRLGLTAEERDAYRLRHAAAEAARRGQVEARLEGALAHAGAHLSGFVEWPDAYSVSFSVDGVPHRSTVRKDDLGVVSAGVCLSGEDRRFDLASLVGVLREGAQAGRLVRVEGAGER